jgi:hypothetical protein
MAFSLFQIRHTHQDHRGVAQCCHLEELKTRQNSEHTNTQQTLF